MTPKQVNKIIEKVRFLETSFNELQEVWENQSDVMYNFYPFEKGFDELAFQVKTWSKHVVDNLMSEVTWEDRNRGIVEEFFGKCDVQTGSADWCGVDVWELDSHMEGESLIRQVLMIDLDNDNDVVLFIRVDDEEGYTTNRDLIRIHQDEQQLRDLCAILARKKVRESKLRP